MTYDVRKAIDADWADMATVIFNAFNDDDDDEEVEAERTIFEPDRTVVATFDDAIVGVAGAFTRTLTVPGGTIPAAHVSMVSVDATHRRQGLLNRMITNLHDTAIALGEPVAVLWASEARIYQRYGYGLAAQVLAMEAQTSQFGLVDPSGDAVRSVPVATSIDIFAKVFDAARESRVGWTDRDERWWKFRLFDGKARRRDTTKLRAIVHDGPDGVDGYLLWRVKGDWDGSGPNGTVIVQELVANTPAAYRAMIRFALSVDLTRNLRLRFGSVTEPLQYMVSDPRRLRSTVSDALWLRILDVPGALTARRYAAPVDVVIEVDDARIPSNNGRWHLIGSPEKATCMATDAPADLAVDAQALGAAYLGGPTLVGLAAAGKVTELRPGALVPASLGFSWHITPSATEIF